MKPTPETLTKLNALAERITADSKTRLLAEGMIYEIHAANYTGHVHIGQKFARVDVGGSGKYMVDLATGEIFGIKAYGVQHKGYRFGTLDTIEQFFWGEYRAMRIAA